MTAFKSTRADDNSGNPQPLLGCQGKLTRAEVIQRIRSARSASQLGPT